jgi:hypothetical protein
LGLYSELYDLDVVRSANGDLARVTIRPQESHATIYGRHKSLGRDLQRYSLKGLHDLLDRRIHAVVLW